MDSELYLEKLFPHPWSNMYRFSTHVKIYRGRRKFEVYYDGSFAFKETPKTIVVNHRAFHAKAQLNKLFKTTGMPFKLSQKMYSLFIENTNSGETREVGYEATLRKNSEQRFVAEEDSAGFLESFRCKFIGEYDDVVLLRMLEHVGLLK